MVTVRVALLAEKAEVTFACAAISAEAVASHVVKLGYRCVLFACVSLEGKLGSV